MSTALKAIEKDIETVGADVVDRMQQLCNESITPIDSADTLFTAAGKAFCEQVFETPPMISLGKVKLAEEEEEEKKKEKEMRDILLGDLDGAKPLIPANYPKITVHHIEKMDLYLTAYDNFLSQWVPDIKFNYSDPGKILSGLGPLANMIKLAFSDQYYTIRPAYLKIRDKIFQDMSLERTTDLTQIPDIPEALLLLEYDQYGPEQFDKQVDDVFAKLKSQDLLDISGHRGTGYFLIWKDNEKDALVALPTIGSFGHFLPEPGFSIIKEYGWPYFRDTEIIGFQIGHIRKVTVETPEGAWEDWELRGPIYLEVTEQSTDSIGDFLSCAYDDNMIMRLQVDGLFFPGIIFGQVG